MRLDPEEWRELVGSYHRAAGRTREALMWAHYALAFPLQGWGDLRCSRLPLRASHTTLRFEPSRLRSGRRVLPPDRSWQSGGPMELGYMRAAQEVFDAHNQLLGSLGGNSMFMGEQVGSASALDSSLLSFALPPSWAFCMGPPCVRLKGFPSKHIVKRRMRSCRSLPPIR